MSGREESQIGSCELEIAIEASKEKVWQALTESTDAWWLGDFRTLGPESTVRFDVRAGGGLFEEAADGAGLLWYTVQMVMPGESLNLIGHTAPAWGGPTLSMLELKLEETEDGCVLKVSDALMGRVSESQVTSLSDGWKLLFGEGLKAFAEK